MAGQAVEPDPGHTLERHRPAGRDGRRRIPKPLLVLGSFLVLASSITLVLLLRDMTNPGGAITTLPTGDYHALAFSPTDPNTVFLGHHNGILRSADGGRTWIPLIERSNFDALSLAASRDGRRIYLAGHNR